jgi:hypothetical protein
VELVARALARSVGFSRRPGFAGTNLAVIFDQPFSPPYNFSAMDLACRNINR